MATESSASQKATLRTSRRSQMFGPVELLLQEAEAAMYDILRSNDPLVDDVATHLLRGGGKRVRPALVLLCGSLAGEVHAYHETLVRVAAAVELIHMATLVHDDIVDESDMRRGLPTVNARWNDQIGVLSGDYLFARSFATLAETGDNRVVSIMSDVVSEMSVGEIKQLGQSHQAQTEQDYIDRIFRKTAYFISQSCRLGAVVSGFGPDDEEALSSYGHGVGMSFQIIDDILDVVGTEEEFGKPIGSDIRAGLYTLPVLYALENSKQKELMRQLLSRPNLRDEDIHLVNSIVKECGAVEHAYERAAIYIHRAKRALAHFNPSPAKQALLALADFVQQRSY